MKIPLILIVIIFCCISYAWGQITFSGVSGDGITLTNVEEEGGGEDALLLEIGDYLLLETGDKLLLE